jgi:chaperonin GroES
MGTKFRPLGDRVVVKQREAQTKSPGGIILPEASQEKPLEGEVLAVGPGFAREDGTVTPPQVKVGEVVLFGKYSGTEHNIEGETFKILREGEILGVIET